MIAEAVNNAPNSNRFYTGQTAGTWFARRTKYQRIKNRTVGGGSCVLATKLTSAYRAPSPGVQVGARSTPTRCGRLSPFERMLKAESGVSPNSQSQSRSGAAYHVLSASTALTL